MIDLTKHDKGEVLAALYNNSKAQGLGILQADSTPMTKEAAWDLLDQSTYFDYLYGRVMKVDLSGDELNPALYDRDLGAGAAERAISTIGV